MGGHKHAGFWSTPSSAGGGVTRAPERAGPCPGSPASQSWDCAAAALSPLSPGSLPSCRREAEGIPCTKRAVCTVTSGKRSQTWGPILSISLGCLRICPKARLPPTVLGRPGCGASVRTPTPFSHPQFQIRALESQKRQQEMVLRRKTQEVNKTLLPFS